MSRHPNIVAISTPTTPPRPKSGQTAHMVRAQGNEDRHEVMARIAKYEWSKRVVGRPVRVGGRWHFVINGTVMP